MAQQNKKDAAARAALAAQQMKYAANNAGGAAEAAAEHVKDEVVENAVEASSKVKELAKKAVFTEAGRGMLYLSIGLITAGVGIQKFQEAKRIRESLRVVVPVEEV